jgi:uncharacterized protein
MPERCRDLKRRTPQARRQGELTDQKPVASSLLTIAEKDGGVVFRIKVQPGARRNEIAGEIDGMLKLKIAAPPVDGKANEECRKFLAGLLGVSPGAVEIKAGAGSRTKTITIRNMTGDYARKQLGLR